MLESQGMASVIASLCQRRTRPLPGLWDKSDFAAREAWKKVVALHPDDKRRIQALRDRQSALAQPLAATGRLLAIDALSVAPFTTGLGNEHPLENGFSFLNPYGVPYLPGSGVKGVLRQAARELAGVADEAIDALFGKEAKDGKDHQRGALTFWDVVPQIKGDALMVEVMTVHQKHYYQDGQSPHESGQPIPINFLTVPPLSGFLFHVQCNLPHLNRLAPALANEHRWQALLGVAFEHAFQWLGFGAKTAVGYGAMERDVQAEEARRVKQAERAAAERLEAEREAARAKMDPVERSIHDFLEQRPDKNQSEISAVIGEVKQGRWQGDEKIAAARWLEQMMKATKGEWKEISQAKKPERDKPYQNTLLVKGWLQGK